MKEAILGALGQLPPVWTTLLVSMLPIVELRGSIPFAIGVGMPWPQALALSVLGNMLPIVPALLLIGPLSEKLRKIPIFDRFFTWLFARTRKKGGSIEKYGPLGLAIFVGIPLPGTGAWTGVAAAYVFGMPLRKSIPAIAAGVVLAGVVVTLAVLGVIGLAGLFTG
jgi:uncharacterized membrane protein